MRSGFWVRARATAVSRDRGSWAVRGLEARAIRREAIEFL
jgi:hypothetical protein